MIFKLETGMVSAEASAAASTPGAPGALIAIGQALKSAGYRFTTVTPLTHQRVNERHKERHNERGAAGLCDVFGWSRPFARDAVAPDLLALMREAGVLADDDGRLRATVRASTLGELVVFHSAYPTSHDDAVFFGPDTYRFVAAIERSLPMLAAPPSRVADVGCGAGPAAIAIARRYPDAEVLALDINDAALALTRVNAGLAGAANVAAIRSDLFGSVGGDFDLIVSNPPYLLDPQKRAYRHGGGPRGAGLSLAIVEAALTRLRPGGALLLYTGVAIGGQHDAFLAQIAPLLERHCSAWRYEELDPDVFGEEVGAPGYEDIDRIAAVWLHATKGTPACTDTE
jgi:methylase of polypeptide subunit release factors